MKRLSEVVKMTGATRKALQEWAKKGLVEPTAVTEGGYWLYDDDAIFKIRLVLLYQEAGYKLSEIKTLMLSLDHNNEEELWEEYDHLIEILKERRGQIDDMIQDMISKRRERE